jgi:two-component system NtrC family sensor kinase
MKSKILSLVGLLSVLFIGAVIWRMNSFIREDRTSWAQAQMRTQILSLQQTLQSMVQDLQHRSNLFQGSDSRHEKSFWSAAEPFKAMAWIKDMNNPTLENILVKDGSGLDDTMLASAVKELTGKSVVRGKMLFVPWHDLQNRNWVMVVWPWAENRKLVLWAGAEYLQGLLEPHKGTLSQLAFVNDSGQVLAHSQIEYFGTRLNDHPLFKEYKTAATTQGGGSYQDSSGENFQGYYEVVPNSNLMIMASASHHDLLADKNKVWASFLFIGLGLVLLTLGGLAMLKISDRDEEPHLNRSAFVLPTAPAPPTVSAPAALKKESLPEPENRHEVFKKIAASLGHELRAPLIRILGFSQMILANEQGESLRGYANSILRETRSARDILEKLFSFAQEQDIAMTPQKVEVSVKKALARIKPELQRHKVQLTEKISETTEIPLAGPLIEKALEAIFQNSMEAMERKPNKEMQLYVRKVTGGCEIVIEDNGEGIEPQNIKKVFDPFYTTRTYAKHLGLGLSAAFGVIRQHGGDLKVESQKGQGTKITISLPEKSQEQPQRTSNTTSIPAEVPAEPISFSPADVEIEKLLDFNELETAPAGLLGVNSAGDAPIVDDGHTVSLNPKDQLVGFVPSQQLNAPDVLEKIDKANFRANKGRTILEDYKVEIRRPRRKVIENS